jgi:DNA-binding transcriptional ArsR family regulator
MTWQAIAKHLRVLERAGVVLSVRGGREQQFAFRPAPLKDAQDYLARVSDQRDRVLLRLKAFVNT